MAEFISLPEFVIDPKTTGISVTGALSAANGAWHTDTGGHAVEGGGVPTVAVGAAGASVALAAGASDQAGVVTVTSPVTPVAGILATLTFGSPPVNAPRAVQADAAGVASANIGLYVTAVSATSFEIGCATAPAASTALAVSYRVAF